QRAAAERAARDKSAFLARVSHELRTPLNAVVGFSELLLNDARNAADSDLARRLDLVTTSARHLAALVDDLLQLSYLDAGAPGPPAQRVVLDEVLRQVMRWVSPLAQRAGVAVLAEPFCGRAVRAPHRHVEQIVTNLLTNAVKYNRSGGKVWIRLCHDDDSGLCGIAVEDNGR
ncbi:MAG: HAMP domain-containing histidine kinase, partial [Blastocatellia bacterium]|nr:HAMP domain-containing histidine kinase [Blastocatellia bacterium]